MYKLNHTHVFAFYSITSRRPLSWGTGVKILLAVHTKLTSNIPLNVRPGLEKPPHCPVIKYCLSARACALRCRTEFGSFVYRSALYTSVVVQDRCPHGSGLSRRLYCIWPQNGRLDGSGCGSFTPHPDLSSQCPVNQLCIDVSWWM